MLALIGVAAKFFTSPVGIVTGKVLGVLAAGLIVFGLYNVHVTSIKNAAIAEANQQQLEQVIKDNKKMLKQLEDIEALQNEISIDLATKNDAARRNTTRINSYINDPSLPDRPSSEVLRGTLRRIRENAGE